MAKLTPMMEQYFEIKNKYQDCLLFYRLGDFYEMFFEDAKVASKELELTLTGRSYGQDEKAPMCGVPFHSCDPYINKLVERGYKVAICEQVEDPAAAKGIVKRDVIRVVTPGTNVISQGLNEEKNNYIMSVFFAGDSYGVAACDLSTGEFATTQLAYEDQLFDEINRYIPSEIICNGAFIISGADLDYVKDILGAVISPVPDGYFDMEKSRELILKQYQPDSVQKDTLKDYPMGVMASGALLAYLYDTQKTALPHLREFKPYSTSEFMGLDSVARRNLELTATIRDGNKRGSLLWVLDKTKTSMGARMLRHMVEQPLIVKKAINDRLDAVEMLKDNVMAREELREYMGAIYDLERLAMRISYRSANPRDLISFKNSLRYLPYIKEIMGQFSRGLLAKMAAELDEMQDMYDLIEVSIVEDPPILIREAGIIKEGYCEQADHLRNARVEGKEWLSDLEKREKETTGIKNLRIRYNKVFGYYIEVTNSYQNLVPDHYIRRQTLANAERYVTEELNELAETILGAQDKLNDLEYQLFVDIREKLASQIDRILKTAKVIAWTDALASLAAVAEANGYHRPKINQKGIIEIRQGRHPVVEQMRKDDLFVANDTLLDHKDNRINIITGPNMAGKSTYMRQTALIVLMAQIGSFVPAASANISITDRIFTRVGASDDLGSGQSTFMVEMNEVAGILKHATRNSLLILDEIGRGTSTYDGLSIAWAVVEYISGSVLNGAKTLFATHYHELTELEGKIPGVHNYCIAVQEKGENIIFLRKILKGGADKSYGIQVAQLAGVPESVIKRAKEIASTLEESDITTKVKNPGENRETEAAPVQLSLFDTLGVMPVEYKESEVEKVIKEADLSNMTPMQALNLLYELQQKL